MDWDIPATPRYAARASWGARRTASSQELTERISSARVTTSAAASRTAVAAQVPPRVAAARNAQHTNIMAPYSSTARVARRGPSARADTLICSTTTVTVLMIRKAGARACGAEVRFTSHSGRPTLRMESSRFIGMSSSTNVR